MMMQTALTVGALPKLRETPSWLPVDVVAKAVVEITLSSAGSVFANVTNPQMFSWTDDLLPALRKSGLCFDEVEPNEWVHRLRNSNPDPTANPPIKLVDFFASKYDKEVTDFTTTKPFATEVACSLSPSLAAAPVLDQALVDKFIKYFMDKAWKLESRKSSNKTVVVVAGPCGTGKTTAGSALAQAAEVPFIEGDSLHTEAAVSKMRSGVALTEDYRMSWLDRIVRHSVEAVIELDYGKVVVSCSALTSAARKRIRNGLRAASVGVVFADLQADQEILARRLEEREGHYMSSAMVYGQCELYENPGTDEVDVVPVDAEVDKSAVIGEITWLLETLTV
jgi:carbohydrate kinase (thermoresistant glucokinase family)